MSREASSPSPRWVATLALAALVVLGLWTITEVLHLAWVGAYALDEYQYAHAGWRIAHGEVIYRDFFEHHLPLVHQLAALVWRLVGDHPDQLQALRALMLPIWALALVAGCWVNRRSCGRFALATVPAVLAVPTLSWMATQLRPDPLAAALFLGALALLYPSRLSPRLRAVLAGAATVAALWATLKVAYYGLILPAALVADLLRRPGERAFLLRPWSFVAGAVAALVPIGLYLTVTGSWADWYRWCIAFSFEHQWHYPGFPWQRNLGQIVQHSFWLFPFALVGVLATVRSIRAGFAGDAPEDDAATARADLLLLGALVTALASVVWQSAAYLYSLVPFTLLLAVLAARGWVVAFRAVARPGGALGRAGGRFALALLALLVVGEQRRTDFAFAKLRQDDNTAQRVRLARLGSMTTPETPVFHVWGGQLSRPSVHYFYVLEAVTMQLQHDRLRRELVPAMIEHGAPVYLHHDLFPRLVPEMRAYLLDNFQPLDADLWVYGRRYVVPENGVLDEAFFAIRDGRYFVSPLAALEGGGTLSIDGRPLQAPIVGLAKGRHAIRYRGPARELFLIWLPADGVPFTPRPELKPAGI